MDQRVKNKIIELWNNGRSAGIIGQELGVTRNTVVGQVNRMRQSGIELRSREVVMKRPHPSIKKDNPPYQKFIPAPITLPTAPVMFTHPRIVKQVRQKNRWVPILLTKNNTCRYTEDGKTFCNHEGYPWCEEHRALVYIPMRIGRE